MTGTPYAAVCFLTLLAPTFGLAPPDDAPKCVRIVYLVSSDRDENPEYTRALEHAALDLQKWYAKQLGGPTFRLHDPIVEVHKSREKAAWFYANPNGANPDDWGFNNTLAEAQRILNARHNDPNFIWILYSDGPGDKGRGGSGVACLPEDDLLGLVGRHPTQKDPLRWIAGLGHELGHALGLPHPEDTEKHADALMWLGIYGKYPDQTYLTDQDKAILGQSPFIYREDGSPVFSLGNVVARYRYNGGSFEQRDGHSPTLWTETKAEDGTVYKFEEVRRTREHVFLKDPSRGLGIRIPLAGGYSGLSTDGGKTWTPLYEVSRSRR